jgi:hypothetical protein
LRLVARAATRARQLISPAPLRARTRHTACYRAAPLYRRLLAPSRAIPSLQLRWHGMRDARCPPAPQVPGLLKVRYIGRTTMSSAAIFGLFLGAGSLLQCGRRNRWRGGIGHDLVPRGTRALARRDAVSAVSEVAACAAARLAWRGQGETGMRRNAGAD